LRGQILNKQKQTEQDFTAEHAEVAGKNGKCEMKNVKSLRSRRALR
jgi:hypothetical protein